jgi:hypothetical protein
MALVVSGLLNKRAGSLADLVKMAARLGVGAAVGVGATGPAD